MATLVSVLIFLSGRRVPGTRTWTTTLSLPNVTSEEALQNATTTKSIFAGLGAQYEHSMKALYRDPSSQSVAHARSRCFGDLSGPPFPTAMAIDEDFCRLDKSKAERIQFDWVSNLRVDDDSSRFSLAIAKRESPAGRDIKRRGGYKKAAAQRIVHRLGPGGTLLDICSDHGWFAFAAASAGAKAIALESDATSLSALQQSACANLKIANGGKLTIASLPEVENGMEGSLKQALPSAVFKNVEDCVAAVVIQCGDRVIDALHASTQYLWTQMHNSKPDTILVLLDELGKAPSESSVAQLRRDSVEYVFHAVGLFVFVVVSVYYLLLHVSFQAEFTRPCFFTAYADVRAWLRHPTEFF
jgi:hypothetical protein